MPETSRATSGSSVRRGPARERGSRVCSRDAEAALRATHERDPLVAAVKADDGAYGRRTSSWHRRSVRRSGELAARAVDAGYTSGLWLDFATNLLEGPCPIYEQFTFNDAGEMTFIEAWSDLPGMLPQDREADMWAEAPDVYRLANLVPGLGNATGRIDLESDAMRRADPDFFAQGCGWSTEP